MSPSITAIALLGYGTVGSAVDRMLRDRADEIARVAGGPVEVRRALVRDAARPREHGRARRPADRPTSRPSATTPTSASWPR